MAGKLPGSAIQSNTISITQIQTTAITSIVEQAGPRVTSLIYPGNDTAGNTVGGQTVYINGSGFETNNAIYINGNAVPSKSFISASNLSFTTPALSAGIYPVYVINTDSGATAIFVPGYISSAEPTWVTGATLSDQDISATWNISLSATGDDPITYALAAGSSLPSGISLAANGVISGTLSSPPATQTTYSFTVVATDTQNQDASRAFSVTVTLSDANFRDTTLLLHGDGTNNGNNQSFLESTANLTVTRTGQANQGSASPFAQTGWSVYFDGNTDSLTYTGGSSINFGTSDFTIELYVNMANTGTFSAFLRPDDSGTFPEFGYDWSTSELKFQARDGAITSVVTTAVTRDTWKHIAVSRSGTSLRLFVDGTQVGNTVTNSTNFGSPANAIRIGGSSFSGTHSVNGYISNFRVVKGTALYTSSFTPPTSALTAVSNTSLLICKSNRFVDVSNNAYSITRNGNVKVVPFSPFAPSISYSAADVGGAVYIPSGQNGLTVGSVPAIGTGSFTVEGWFWPTTTGEFPSAWTLSTENFNGSASIQGGVGTGIINFRYNGTSGFDVSSSINLANQWNHIAWVRNGSAANVYLNGVSVGSGSFTNSISGGNAYISRPDSSSFRYNGWISGFRVVSGTALYTANFTPPTAPPTSSSNAICLLNFTNGQVIDHTAQNVLELAGDAKSSTTQFKYGTGSIAFDGTGDYIKILRNGGLLDFGTGDFTVETWVRFNTVGIDQAIFASDTTNGAYDFVYRTGQGLVVGRYNTAWDSTFSWSPSINTWYHIAWARSGTSLKAFVDGVQIGSTATNSNAYNGGSTFSSIGASAGGGDRLLNGFLDDLRITKGYARYTSNFTAPTSALKDR